MYGPNLVPHAKVNPVNCGNLVLIVNTNLERMTPKEIEHNFTLRLIIKLKIALPLKLFILKSFYNL